MSSGSVAAAAAASAAAAAAVAGVVCCFELGNPVAVLPTLLQPTQSPHLSSSAVDTWPSTPTHHQQQQK
jgi:hypothetical protein